MAITHEERKKIWREALERERATRRPGCQNGDIGKAGLAVLHCLLFDFLNMKTGVCFPRVRALQERLWPWFSRAAIFRALDRLEASGVLVRVHRRMRAAGKVVQGATLYVFAKVTEAEQAMVRKAKALAKVTARAIRPVLWRDGVKRRRSEASESQSASVPSENLIFRSKSGEKPALKASAHERASIGLQMRELLASLRGRPAAVLGWPLSVLSETAAKKSGRRVFKTRSLFKGTRAVKESQALTGLV